MDEDLGWAATYALLAVGWLVVFGLHVARGSKQKRDEGSVYEVEIVDVAPELWVARLIAIVFFAITLGFIFSDPDLHAWALTRYTVWTLVCSLAYLVEIQKHIQNVCCGYLKHSPDFKISSGKNISTESWPVACNRR